LAPQQRRIGDDHDVVGPRYNTIQLRRDFYRSHVRAFMTFDVKMDKEEGPVREYVFVYLDDLLIPSKKRMVWIDKLKASYDLKEDSIRPPATYLGAQIGQTQISNGYSAWHMRVDKYVTNAVQKLLDKDGDGLITKRAKSAFLSGSKPKSRCTRGGERSDAFSFSTIDLDPAMGRGAWSCEYVS
jgi:hypothetical protein